MTRVKLPSAQERTILADSHRCDKTIHASQMSHNDLSSYSYIPSEAQVHVETLNLVQSFQISSMSLKLDNGLKFIVSVLFVCFYV